MLCVVLCCVVLCCAVLSCVVLCCVVCCVVQCCVVLCCVSEYIHVHVSGMQYITQGLSERDLHSLYIPALGPHPVVSIGITV